MQYIYIYLYEHSAYHFVVVCYERTGIIMKRSRKAALTVLTSIYIFINKNYKLYRTILNVFKPHFVIFRNSLDHKMIVGDREIPLRVFNPKSDPRNKALIFFHGGGWVSGNIDTYTKFCSDMAEQTKHTVIAVNYRLAPENPFPAGLEDCYYVTSELLKDPCLVNCLLEDITIIGDSAGGNLAAALSLLARDRGELMPSKQILLYPATYFDHSEGSPFKSVSENGTDYILTSKQIQAYLDMYVQCEDDKFSPYVAPILANELSNQPKTLIITAEYDPLRDEGEAYGFRLKESNNDVIIYRMKDSLHGFMKLGLKSKAVKKCYEIINDFLSDKSNQGVNQI
jgi:acetyl esterase